MHRGFQNPAAPPRRLTVPRSRVNPTAENQSLINSIRSDALTFQETETCLQSLFNLMTSSEEEDEAQFREVVSALGDSYRPSMASLLTSNSDRFLEIARYKTGSDRLQTLLGKSADADIFFLAAILCRFVDVMTDKGASFVAIEGLQVFDEVKRRAMYPHIVFHAAHLACHGRGSITLKKIISNLRYHNLADRLYRDEILDKVASNALSLSSDAFGSYVVQDVLELYGVNTPRKVANNLNGHFVELSRTKYGSRVVERLLKTVESRPMVVAELLKCDERTLMSLACSEYGSFVVGEALRVTQDESMTRPEPFRGLVTKLIGHFVELSLTEYGSRVVERLLKTVESRPMVVAELSEYDEHRLKKLACSEYGSVVVGEALRVTQNKSMNQPDLFWVLVDKLTPFHRHLRMSKHGRTIAEFLDSIDY